MTTFPTTIDVLTNPISTSSMATVSHSDQHINANDAIEAIEAKVGVTGSGVATSHDYRIAILEAMDIPTVETQTAATRNETSTEGVVIILCNCTSNAITVNLPTAVGNSVTITFKKTDSTSNTVTIDGLTTETIDGGLTAILQVQDEAITIISNNTNWSII